VSLRRLALALAALLCAAPAAAAGTHPSLAPGQACVTAACHAAARAAATPGATVHDPYAGGDCAACHDLGLVAVPHFVKGAPAGAEGAPEGAAGWDLALCAGCHDESLLAPEARSSGFADGRRNLHTLHVQAGRGRRCLPCHHPHTAAQAMLLRRRIPARKGVEIPQEFRGEPRGGWCRTGCHAPKRYLR
jgi:predicted CXXCH cytochrome family protein